MITTTRVNREFRIRYFANGGKSTMITASKYIDLIGDEKMAYLHFKRAFYSGMDKYTIRLRRGIRIDFYSK